MSTLSTSSVSLFLPRLLPASIPHFVHSHSLTRKSVQCSKELMNTHLLLKNLEKNCLILVKCSMQYLQYKIGLQCGNDKIGSSCSHSIIAGNWLKLKVKNQLTSCACFLVSPLYGPFKRRFKEMGEADGRNFSCLLHGFPSKLGRASLLPMLEGKK